MISEPHTGTFHDARTGETIVRELTPEEIAALPEPGEPLTPFIPE
jgi:hypothetical protein